MIRHYRTSWIRLGGQSMPDSCWYIRIHLQQPVADRACTVGNGRLWMCYMSELRIIIAKVLYPELLMCCASDQIYQTQLNNEICVITSVT